MTTLRICINGYPVGELLAGAVLHGLNIVLRPAGLVLRSRPFEAAYERAMVEHTATLSRDLAAARAHLGALGELLVSVGYSQEAVACRRIVDTALGRETPAAA